MFCGKCGASVENTQVFCVSCGFQLNTQSSATASSTVLPPPLNANMSIANAPKPMGLIETIKFSYKNYARFSGRASRSEYWYWYLFTFGGFIPLGLIVSGSTFSSLLSVVFLLSTIVPGWARGTRRLHDINKSGAFLFLGLIPLVGFVLLIVFFCTRGDDVANRYGPPNTNVLRN